MLKDKNKIQKECQTKTYSYYFKCYRFDRTDFCIKMQGNNLNKLFSFALSFSNLKDTNFYIEILDLNRNKTYFYYSVEGACFQSDYKLSLKECVHKLEMDEYYDTCQY